VGGIPTSEVLESPHPVPPRKGEGTPGPARRSNLTSSLFLARGVVWRCRAAVLGLLLLALALPLGAAAQSVKAPEIVPRSAWGAKPPDTSLMQAHTPREIVIHHTAEPPQPRQTLAQKLQRLQRFSRAEGSVEDRPKPAWGDVPYHYYIDAAGRIAEGRSIDYAGDTNTPYRTAGRIQIVLEGHFDNEEPGAAQIGSLDRLVVWLAAKYRIPAAKVSGHNDHVPSSDCPGRNLKRYLPLLREKVAKASTSG
jgi:hypothetical protein